MSPVPPFRSFLALVVAAVAAVSSLPGSASFVEVEVASVGVELSTGQPLALLHSEWEQVLPIWIGPNEAEALALGLTETPTPRPMTHDLTASILESLGGELEAVQVTDLVDGTYIGVLQINGPDGPLEIDTRPSDGLALAVRTGARIEVAESLFDAGLDDINFMASDGLKPVVRIRGITLGMPEAPSDDGLHVLHVTREIQRLDVESGDRILSLAGQGVSVPMDVLQALRGQRQADGFSVVRARNGEEETIQIPPPRGPSRIGP